MPSPYSSNPYTKPQTAMSAMMKGTIGNAGSAYFDMVKRIYREQEQEQKAREQFEQQRKLFEGNWNRC